MNVMGNIAKATFLRVSLRTLKVPIIVKKVRWIDTIKTFVEFYNIEVFVPKLNFESIITLTSRKMGMLKIILKKILFSETIKHSDQGPFSVVSYVYDTIYLTAIVKVLMFSI